MCIMSYQLSVVGYQLLTWSIIYSSFIPRLSSFPLLAPFRGQPFKVLLNDIAIVRGKVAADLLQGLFALLGRKIAPVAFRADIALGHVAGAFSAHRHAVLGRTGGAQCIAAAGRLLLLLLLFYFLL